MNEAIQRLLGEFENEIRFDCHKTITSYCRSAAGAKLLEQGKAVLHSIVDHLRTTPPAEEWVRTAWCFLLHDFAVRLEPRAVKQANTFDDWLEWAGKTA
jgi:hypothetical protein